MRVGWSFTRAVGMILLAGASAMNPVSASPVWNQATGIGSAVEVVSEPSTNNMYAVVQGTGAGIYRSTDGAHSFTLLKSFTNPYKLSVGIGARLWAATSQGLYKTNDLITWTLVSGGLPGGASVTYIGRAGQGVTLYATVAGGTLRGLYRSLDYGVSWARVITKAATQSVTDGTACGTSFAQTVFAGGSLSLGGPACTLLKSTDGGASFSCTSFPHSVNQAVLDCTGNSSTNPNFTHLYVTSPEGTPAQAVRRSTDAGATFLNDGVGLIDAGATNTIDFAYDYPGIVVGSMNTGLFQRSGGPAGSPWSQYSTQGLLDQHIKRWAIFNYGGVYYYVVATPSGVFYFAEPPPCGYPCP